MVLKIGRYQGRLVVYDPADVTPTFNPTPVRSGKEVTTQTRGVTAVPTAPKVDLAGKRMNVFKDVKPKEEILSKSYDPVSGYITKEVYHPQTKWIEDRQEFYGYPSTRYPQQTMTATTVKPKFIAKQEKERLSIQFEQTKGPRGVGYGLTETAKGVGFGFITAPISLISMPIGLARTGIETLKHGPSVVQAKARKTVYQFSASLGARPEFTLGAVAGSMAFGSALSKGYQAFKGPKKIKSVGASRSEITGARPDIGLYKGKGKGIYKTPKLGARTEVEYGFLTKKIPKKPVSIGFSAGKGKTMVSRKMFGTKYYKVTEFKFTGADLTRKTPSGFFSAFVSKSKEKMFGIGTARKIGKTKTQDVFRVGSIAKGKGAIFGTQELHFAKRFKDVMPKAPAFKPDIYAPATGLKIGSIGRSLHTKFIGSIVKPKLNIPIFPATKVGSKSRSAPKIGLNIPMGRSRTKTVSKPKIGLIQTGLQKSRKKSRGRIGSLMIGIQARRKSDLRIGMLQAPIQRQRQKQKLATKLDLGLKFPTGRSFPFSFGRTVPTPFPSGMGLIGLGPRRKRKKGRIKTRQPRGYVPSLGAGLLGIYGKKPKGLLTGLEVRPLIRRRKKKTKKKKKKRR